MTVATSVLIVLIVLASIGFGSVVTTIGILALVAYGNRRAGDPVPSSLNEELAGPFTHVRVVATPARRREDRRAR